MKSTSPTSNNSIIQVMSDECGFFLMLKYKLIIFTNIFKNKKDDK